MSTPVHYDTELRIDPHAGRYEGRLEAQLHLDEPRTRIVVRVPTGSVGRAEAKFGRQSWAAAHYWTEETEDGNVVLFEFSEALPAGDLRLSIPFSGELTPSIAALTEDRDAQQLQAVLPHLAGGPGEWSLRLGRPALS
jgi:hypothetical protein